MVGTYNLWMVLLSVLIACAAAYTALSLVQKIATNSKRILWIAAGALVIGSGIWSMHFIGMLALRLPIPLFYDIRITAISWLLAVISSGFAFWFAFASSHTTQISTSRWILSSLLLGTGIISMHYVGMAAMPMMPAISYNPALVTLSMLIGFTGSGAALWFLTRMNPAITPPSEKESLKRTASLIIGLAISALHYSGMAAAEVSANAICQNVPFNIHGDLLALPIGIIVLLLMGFMLVITLSASSVSIWRMLLVLVVVESVVMYLIRSTGLNEFNYAASTALDIVLLAAFMTPVFWLLRKNSLSLIAEKERSLATLSSIGDAVIVVDNIGKVEFLNPLAEEMLGITLENCAGLPIQDLCKLVDSDTRDPIEIPIFKVLRKGLVTMQSDYVLLLRADGHEYPIESSAAPILDHERNVSGVVMVLNDVTQRLLHEKKLHDSEDHWRLALEANEDGLFDWDVTTGKEWFSPRYHEIYGYADGELSDEFNEWINRLHKEDRKAVLAHLEDYLHGRSPIYSIEYRMRCKNGEWKWIHARGKLVSRDAKGKPLRIVGTHEDIDLRKAQEDEMRLAASVFEKNSESIIITCPPHNKIIHVNPAFTRITGYSEEDVLGRDTLFLRSGKHDESFYQAIQNDLRLDGYWSGELWRARKNGEIYPEWVHISAIKDDRGQVLHYVAISNDISKAKQDEEKIRELAYYDTLTNLPNRRLLEDRLKLALANAHRNDKFVALLFMDLDHFKQVNDSLGHLAGDNLLQQTTQRILACVREGDTVARQGGDEFVLLLPDLANNADALYAASTVGEKIREALSTPFNLDGMEASVTPSIGISIFPTDTEDMVELIRNADTAMYHAKNNGRNNYQFYAHDMNASAVQRLGLDNALRYAIERKELSLVYQPQVDADGRILSVEALLRWNSATLGEIPPAKFIPIAEENGLILTLGNWVIDAACKQKKLWMDAGLCAEMARVAINISPRQFFQPVFINQLLRIMEKHGVTASSIELELTEGILMHDTNDTILKLTELKKLGFKISVDDFGTGYSSLAYLKYFPVDVLKIDQSFVHGLDSNPDDASISRAIIAMAKSLNLTVIAEGVENDQQFSFLRQYGCDAYQGFHFSRPIKAEALSKLLKKA
ncbi:MAG: EAL domain-containing protein [Methylophilaceae bacterium]